jgi:hypothetical protein
MAVDMVVMAATVVEELLVHPVLLETVVMGEVEMVVGATEIDKYI